MKLTKMIYIASPYNYYHWCPLIDWVIKFYRYYKITKIIGMLQDKYKYAFIGPITQSHHTSKYMKSKCGLFKSWELRDLTYISRCDEVWVIKMSGWKESKGVQAEIKFAKNIVLAGYNESWSSDPVKVRYIDPETLKFVRGG